MKHFFNILLFLCFVSSSLYANTHRDSLIIELNSKTDSLEIVQYQIKIAELFEYDNPDSARYFYEKAVRLSQLIKNDSLYITAYLSTGYMFEVIGRADTALIIYENLLESYKNTTEKKTLNPIYNALGNIYYYNGNFEEALKYYHSALKIAKEIKNELWQAYAYHNIGLVYSDLKENKTTIDYYNKALSIFLKYNDKNWLSTCYNSLGAYYMELDSLEASEENYRKGLAIYLELGDYVGISMLYDNLARIFIERNQNDSAFAYLQKALAIAKDLDDYYSLSSINHGLAKSAFNMHEYKSSIDYAKEGLKYARKSGWKSSELSLISILKSSYANLQEYKSAFMYADSLIILRNDLFNSEKTKAVQEIEGKYQSKQKQLLIENLEKEQALKNKENRQQRVLLIIAFIGAFVILMFSLFLFKTLIAKKKANIKLKEQQKEITEQNEELNQLVEETMAQKEEIEQQENILRLKNHQLEETQIEIGQSIEYAKRIQNSILPNLANIDQHLDSHFLIFRPKDNVSGDFYWWTQIENQIIVTVADCTGHGVPGAFMSMLGISFLREIILKEYITHPGVILRKLRKEIINALQQKGVAGEQKDGMDMSLVSINKETLLMQYSGANNPIYIVRKEPIEEKNNKIKKLEEFNNESSNLIFHEIKPDKMPIAIYDNLSRFELHEIHLQKGDQIYLFSDGYADQFGGPKNKKFKYKTFKNTIIKNANLPMEEQKNILQNTFVEWIGANEQVDDILVLGIKI